MAKSGLNLSPIFLSKTAENGFKQLEDPRSFNKRHQFLKTKSIEANLTHLKVVGNEKEGGSGKWQMIDIGLRLW